MGVKDGKKYILPPSGEDVFLFEVAKGSRVALDLMCIIHMLVPYHYHGLFTKSPHDEASFPAMPMKAEEGNRTSSLSGVSVRRRL